MNDKKQEFIEKYRISQAIEHPDTFMTKLRHHLTFTNFFGGLFIITGVFSLLIYVVSLVSYESIKDTYNNLEQALHSAGVTGSLENTFFANYSGQNKLQLQYARAFNLMGPWVISIGIILIMLGIFIKWGLPEIIKSIKERNYKKYE